jgi:hypothetical protein
MNQFRMDGINVEVIEEDDLMTSNEGEEVVTEEGRLTKANRKIQEWR